MKRFIATWILLSAGLNIWQSIYIKKLEAQNDFLKGLCNNQLEIIMDYEWKQMQEQATFIKANTRKWRAR